MSSVIEKKAFYVLKGQKQRRKVKFNINFGISVAGIPVSTTDLQTNLAFSLVLVFCCCFNKLPQIQLLTEYKLGIL